MKFYNIGSLVKIPVHHEWKKIGISLSGGADSALLAYLLCDIITQQNLQIEIHCISHVRMWKTRPWQQYDSLRVCDYLKDQFTSITFVRHTNFIAPDLEHGFIGASITDEYGKLVSGDNIQIRAYSEFVCHRENLDAYFNGVTRNPRNLDFKGMTSRDIESTEDNQHLYLMEHMGRTACHPFRFIEKSWVIQQYRDLNILDLLNMTRSCEGEFTNIDYSTYTAGQYVPICNKCFWCKEREWAMTCQS